MLCRSTVTGKRSKATELDGNWMVGIKEAISLPLPQIVTLTKSDDAEMGILVMIYVQYALQKLHCCFREQLLPPGDRRQERIFET
jgi:hypothetical protein